MLQQAQRLFKACVFTVCVTALLIAVVYSAYLLVLLFVISIVFGIGMLLTKWDDFKAWVEEE